MIYFCPQTNSFDIYNIRKTSTDGGPTSLVAGLQQVAAGFVGDSGELGPVAAQPGPAQGAAVLLQPRQLGRRGLGLGHAVDQLGVLLAQTRLAEMFHHSQHLGSLSPARGEGKEREGGGIQAVSRVFGTRGRA